MKKTSLKSLFKKKRFDWTSDEYKKKSITLLKQSIKLEFYEDESHDKKNFVERFKNAIKD